MAKRYYFSLTGVNLKKVEDKYGINFSSVNNHIPDNATKIDDLEVIVKKTPVLSFLDESKKLRKCTVSIIDFASNEKYKCFWDKNDIPEGVKPIGCPIKYVASRAVKSYFSEISKEKYKISENITEKRKNELENRKDQRLKVNDKDYYETDGIFCSFNCCMAYIRDVENKRNPLYNHSETLLLKMYNEFHSDEEITEIIPAGHWRLLKDFGGTLTIEKFRENFNKIQYYEHGLVSYVSLGRLYEDQIKF
jgi:hypothetical protein